MGKTKFWVLVWFWFFDDKGSVWVLSIFKNSLGLNSVKHASSGSVSSSMELESCSSGGHLLRIN